MSVASGWSQWPVSAFDAFTDVTNASFVALTVAAGASQNTGIELHWNTYGGKSNVELYSPVDQDVYINMMVWWPS